MGKYLHLNAKEDCLFRKTDLTFEMSYNQSKFRLAALGFDRFHPNIPYVKRHILLCYLLFFMVKYLKAYFFN